MEYGGKVDSDVVEFESVFFYLKGYLNRVKWS